MSVSTANSYLSLDGTDASSADSSLRSSPSSIGDSEPAGEPMTPLAVDSDDSDRSASDDAGDPKKDDIPATGEPAGKILVTPGTTDEKLLLQRRLDEIAAASKQRNPTGFRDVAKAERSRSWGSGPDDPPLREGVTPSGQRVVFAVNAVNVPSGLVVGTLSGQQHF